MQPAARQRPLHRSRVAIGGVDPLPFFEMGEQTNLDCDELLAGLGGDREG